MSFVVTSSVSLLGNANILSIGARFMDEGEIRNVLEIWFDESFEGGRHQRRIDKLDQ